MNTLDARAIRYQGQFIGQFRKVHKAAWETVCENGEPIRFTCPHKAENAGWRILKAHMGEVYGWRAESVLIARDEAEKLFRKGAGHGEANGTQAKDRPETTERATISPAR